MPTFMPVDEQESIKLNEELSHTLYNSVPNFVKYYNQNVINRKHEDVQRIANRISEVYRDVKERNGKFVFFSEQEVYLTEITNVLEKWNTIIKLKRELSNLINDRIISPEGKFVLVKEQLGYISFINEEGQVERANSERVYGRWDFAESLYKEYSTAKDDELYDMEICQFNVRDITNLDDSFINRMYQNIPK